MRRFMLLLLLLLFCAFPVQAESPQASFPVDESLVLEGEVLDAYATETETVFKLLLPDGSYALEIALTRQDVYQVPLPCDVQLEAYHVEPGYVTIFADHPGVPDSLTYGVDEYACWLDTFRIGSCVYDALEDYVSVHDEMTGVMSFYRRDGWPKPSTSLEEIAAWGASIPKTRELVFALDLDNDRMLLPDGETLPLPAMEELTDAYDRASRIFLSIETEDGGHLLRIVTLGERAEVLDIPVPWTCWFDSFHVGPDDDTVLYPSFYIGSPDYYVEMSFYWENGCWELGVVNNSWEIIAFQDYAICRDIDNSVTFGEHPWHTLESLDFSTLPLTYAEAAAALTKEGWLFAAEDLSLLSAPDAAAEAVASCTADTPLAVLRFEGDWALVGLHQENMWDSLTGYVPVERLRAEPVSVIPGGEMDGWFYTMTVEDGILRFDSPLAEWTFTPLRVLQPEFETIARALFREQGYAATPARFDPALYPCLDCLIYEEWTIHDLFLTEKTAVVSVDTKWGHRLTIVTDPADPLGEVRDLDITLPGPFHFDREDWFWGDIVVVMDE